jgi:hypothetical protein
MTQFTPSIISFVIFICLFFFFSFIIIIISVVKKKGMYLKLAMNWKINGIQAANTIITITTRDPGLYCALHE